MPQNYSLNAKQLLTIDAPIRNFTVQTGSVVVSKHDELIATTVQADESFACDDRGGLDFLSSEAASIAVLFTEEAQLAESGRHPGENVERARKRQRGASKSRNKKRKAARETKAARKKAATKEGAARGDTGGGDSGGFESRTVTQLRKLAKDRKIDVPSKATKPGLIAALRKAR